MVRLLAGLRVASEERRGEFSDPDGSVEPLSRSFGAITGDRGMSWEVVSVEEVSELFADLLSFRLRKVNNDELLQYNSGM